MIADLLTMAVCFYVASHWGAGWGRLPSLTALLQVQLRVWHVLAATACLMICHVTFVVMGLYHSRRLSTRSTEAMDAVKAVVVVNLIIGGFGRSLHIGFISWPLLARMILLSATGALVSRLLMRLFLYRLRLRGRNLRHMLVVGTNARALQFAASIEARPWLGYKLLGFVDEDSALCMQTFRTSGRTRVCDFANFHAYLKTHVVDEVVICLPMCSYYQQGYRIAVACQEQGLIVRVSADLFDFGLQSARVDHLEGTRLVTILSGGMQGWPMFVKSVLDHVLSIMLLGVFSPLMLVTAVVMKLTSPGPIFYVQERVGFNKRRFKLLKFRTMVRDAERRQQELAPLNETTGPAFKIKDDPRVTAIGRILRKYSIDELPQLINVLKGDMSLVGPRPLPVRDCEGFTTDWHRRRFSVRPGISCLWQVSGRSHIGFEDWMKLDMQYIDQWSLWLDFKILLKTVRAVVEGAGAW